MTLFRRDPNTLLRSGMLCQDKAAQLPEPVSLDELIRWRQSMYVTRFLKRNLCFNFAPLFIIHAASITTQHLTVSGESLIPPTAWISLLPRRFKVAFEGPPLGPELVHWKLDFFFLIVLLSLWKNLSRGVRKEESCPFCCIFQGLEKIFFVPLLLMHPRLLRDTEKHWIAARL